MNDAIYRLLAEHGRLPVDATSIGQDQDLYTAGLTSFAAVQLMLALEEEFDVEFPERMLNRRSFQSVAAIAACLAELTAEKAA